MVRLRRESPLARGVTAPQRNPLAQLIRERMAALDMTYEEVAERGGWKTHSSVYSLANKQHHRQTPRSSTLERLARGLDLPLETVRTAAARSAGYSVEDSPMADFVSDFSAIADALLLLTPEERRDAVAYVTGLAERETPEDDAGEAEG